MPVTNTHDCVEGLESQNKSVVVIIIEVKLFIYDNLIAAFLLVRFEVVVLLHLQGILDLKLLPIEFINMGGLHEFVFVS